MIKKVAKYIQRYFLTTHIRIKYIFFWIVGYIIQGFAGAFCVLFCDVDEIKKSSDNAVKYFSEQKEKQND